MTDERGRWLKLRAIMRAARVGVAVGLAVAAAAGCASKEPPKPALDPNLYPANYRQQIATLLQTMLRDPADFRASFIAQPVLMQVGDRQHYVVCVQLDGHNQHKDKVAIYLAGSVTQFIDATPEQCGNAPYQPFTELAKLSPS